jgi:hypothetical protein
VIHRVRIRLHDEEMAALASLAEDSGQSFNTIMRVALRKITDLGEPDDD